MLQCIELLIMLLLDDDVNLLGFGNSFGEQPECISHIAETCMCMNSIIGVN